MEPRLLFGDHLFVDRRGDEPARGDVVVFRRGRDPSGGLLPCHENPHLPCEGFIKRIVAIPGDTVRFDGAALYVNEELLTREPGSERVTGPQGEAWQMRRE